jgi:rfaE bifunctional protein kinase chain/domain
LIYEDVGKMVLKFPEVTILVVGDYFLDKYLIVDRAKDEPSLETGLTAYQVVNKRLSPGAAGTVVNNLKALGVGRVITLGIIGEDGEGYDLEKGLKAIKADTSGLIKTPYRVTPTYTKPMSIKNGVETEMNRLDIKNWTPTPTELEDQVIEGLYDLLSLVDAVIVVDQVTEKDCGVVTTRVKKAISKMARSKKDFIIYADSRAYIDDFTDIMVKCNVHELMRIFGENANGISENDVVKCAKKLQNKTGKTVFITMGEKGQMVVSDKKTVKVPAIKVEGPIDITGAGDSVTAGTVAAMCAGLSPQDAALIGNIVASITIQQIGTTGIAVPEEVLERTRRILANI